VSKAICSFTAVEKYPPQVGNAARTIQQGLISGQQHHTKWEVLYQELFKVMYEYTINVIL
jgi:hypothetical protein